MIPGTIYRIVKIHNKYLTEDFGVCPGRLVLYFYGGQFCMPHDTFKGIFLSDNEIEVEEVSPGTQITFTQ